MGARDIPGEYGLGDTHRGLIDDRHLFPVSVKCAGAS